MIKTEPGGGGGGVYRLHLTGRGEIRSPGSRLDGKSLN